MKNVVKSFIPLQITIKNSKFGPTLVIVSTESSGGYVLGFRVDPPAKLYTLHKEILTLLKTFEKFPIFGVDYTVEHQVMLYYSYKKFIK